MLQDCANSTKCFMSQTYGWPINSWCVGNVKDMSYLFYNMDTFNEDINGWDTSSVTDTSRMFGGASSFNRDLSNFDTSSVTDMGFMFQGATSFNQDLCSWRDSFPYTAYYSDIFTNSNCTYQETRMKPKKDHFVLLIIYDDSRPTSART